MLVTLTGYSGFLGNIIHSVCIQNGLSVIKVGRSKLADIHWDFTGQIPEMPKSDLVIHCAGLAHRVNNNGLQNDFFKVNYDATVNLCEALKLGNAIPSSFVFISTAAVYGLETGENIGENFEPNPNTPYGKSKLKAEEYLSNWAQTNKVNLLVLRLPLVVGENPPGNLGAMIKAIKKGYYFRLGNGLAKRSMVLAEDVAHFILASHGKNGIINLTDGLHPSYAEIENYIAGFFHKKIHALPEKIVVLLGKIGDLFPFFPINTIRVNKLKQNLTISDELARRNFNWKSRPVIGNFKPF